MLSKLNTKTKIIIFNNIIFLLKKLIKNKIKKFNLINK